MRSISFLILFLVVAFDGLAAELRVGDVFPPVSLKNIHGLSVELPDPKSKWVHLQFRRFAGCPICNLHLQKVIARHSEIKDHGIREVVFFHSPVDSLLPYQGKFPFDVVADPERKYYRQFNVSSSLMSVLHPGAWLGILNAMFSGEKPPKTSEDDHLGLPADFLISSDGRVVAANYGRHANDQWSVPELLQLAQ